MYYPYLRGKQFELLALREFSSEFKNYHTIVPIIEPVKKQVNGLNAAALSMIENGMKFAVILNPSDGGSLEYDCQYQYVYSHHPKDSK